ncbi:hypothetical protein [uncultured Chitinophaga sp.]|uniref:hypothetical protein n=1 Tax=uncultured Chitinophaga sp. TaxID=339340 RepID=UPI0025DC4E19|nr:hypothetical protein [uncultured Chitinophaga sp.]
MNKQTKKLKINILFFRFESEGLSGPENRQMFLTAALILALVLLLLAMIKQPLRVGISSSLPLDAENIKMATWEGSLSSSGILSAPNIRSN